MAVFSQTISDTNNDGFEIGGGTPDLTTRTEVGDHSGASTTSLWRFTNVTIAQGATINSATITLTGADTYTGPTTMFAYFGCEDVDTSGTLSTSDGNIANRAANITTAQTDYDLHIVALGTAYPITITSAVSEVISRAGWASGNALSVMAIDHSCPSDEWQYFYDYSGSAVKAAAISIDYTESSGGAISGTAAGLATASATFTQASALAGTADGTGVAAATIRGAGRAIGRTTCTGDAVLRFVGKTVGSAAGTGTAVGLAKGAGALRGGADGVADCSATIANAGSTSYTVGAALGDATATATLNGAIALSGETTCTADVSGTLLGSAALTCETTGSADVSGTLAGAGVLIGQADGSAIASGALVNAVSTVYTIGEAWGDATVTATLLGDGYLFGDCTASATQDATLSANGVLIGEITGMADAVLIYVPPTIYYAPGTRVPLMSQARTAFGEVPHADEQASGRGSQSVGTRAMIETDRR
jgi:hypothetical protein